MFGSALSVEDARKQVATVIMRKATGREISDSEVNAVYAKKVKCDECGKKSIIAQCVKLIDKGFDLTCPHCGVSRPTIIVAGVPEQS